MQAQATGRWDEMPDRPGAWRWWDGSRYTHWGQWRDGQWESHAIVDDAFELPPPLELEPERHSVRGAVIVAGMTVLAMLAMPVLAVNWMGAAWICADGGDPADCEAASSAGWAAWVVFGIAAVGILANAVLAVMGWRRVGRAETHLRAERWSAIANTVVASIGILGAILLWGYIFVAGG